MSSLRGILTHSTKSGILNCAQYTGIVCLISLLASPLAFANEFVKAELVSSNHLPTTVYPIVGTRVSSKFGMRMHPVVHKRRHHAGLDLAAPSEASVRAIQAGTVIFADPHGGYGNLIVIRHDDGLTSHYGHLHKIKIKIGGYVSAGQLIGSVGSTGRVTGPHLHFELRKNGKPLDPLSIFPNIALRGEG